MVDCFYDCRTNSVWQHVIKMVFHTRGFFFCSIFHNDSDNWCVSSLCVHLVSIILVKVPCSHMNVCLLDHFRFLCMFYQSSTVVSETRADFGHLR